MSTTVITTTTTTTRNTLLPMVKLHSEGVIEPISQRLIDVAHLNETELATELMLHNCVDVNFIGTVSLKSRKSEVVLNGESASEVRAEYEEFRTDVTSLFLAAHNGNIKLVRKLLSAGANVNQKLFRGYATTAAVREGHMEVLEMLVDGGASQAACEEALMEACFVGRTKHAEQLMASDMIRPHVAVHALVVASSRGFVDFVETLVKIGVDVNATVRILLQSSKPSLHASVDCNALFAAVVNRQISVVQLLLKVGCRIDSKVRLGAWSWDVATGEEFRVGAGLAEPYRATWCAVEYFESSGAILRMLLQHVSPNIPHLGRTIIHHAILCGNARAVEVLLSCDADIEFPIETSKQIETRPIHLATRLGSAEILRQLIKAGCNVNSLTGLGETAVMICARHDKQQECLKLLASSGADLGLTNASGQSAISIAGSVRWALGFKQALLEVIREGKVVRSSNPEVFSSLLFVTRANDVEALKKLIKQPDTINLDEKDENGFSAVMIAAASGHAEAFKLLVNAGAGLEMQNKFGETALTLAEANQSSDAFAKILSAYAYAKGRRVDYSQSSLIHRATRLGDMEMVRELANENNDDINALDSEGYTPLMLAARSGDGKMCELLISRGASCDVENSRRETALSLARKCGSEAAEGIILDELARRLVILGARVKKHTKGGKGAPHTKLMKMVEGSGVLRWGKSSRRNVICRVAEVGPSSSFRWNRRKKSDVSDLGLFRVVTTKNHEFHFSCHGGDEMAQLWVRGIRLVTREAIFGNA